MLLLSIFKVTKTLNVDKHSLKEELLYRGFAIKQTFLATNRIRSTGRLSYKNHGVAVVGVKNAVWHL